MTSAQFVGRWATVAALALIGTSSVPVAAKDKNSTQVEVVNAENPDRYPYYEFASTTIAPPFVNNFIQFPTPLGSLYFIEQVSVSCTTTSNTDTFTQALLSVTKKTSPTSTQGFSSPIVVLEKRGPSFFGGYIWTGSAHIKVISDANPLSVDGSGALFINVFHTDSTAQATCFATLFGHSLPL